MQVEYKLAWTIPIMLMPLFGGTFYLLFGARTGSRRQMLRYSAVRISGHRSEVGRRRFDGAAR